MEKELSIACPDCGTILIVDRVSGKILETRRPLVEKPSGDRLTDAFGKMKADKEKRDRLFAEMNEAEERKKRLAEELFNASLKEAKESGEDIRPTNIFDRD
jgi:predicted  nucleic acid-binding Zn-ribbon protein